MNDLKKNQPQNCVQMNNKHSSDMMNQLTALPGQLLVYKVVKLKVFAFMMSVIIPMSQLLLQEGQH